MNDPRPSVSGYPLIRRYIPHIGIRFTGSRLFILPFFPEFPELFLHIDRHPTRPDLLVRQFHGSAEKCDDGIPFILVQRAFVADENIGHGGHVLIEQVHELMGGQFFRKCGKSLNIGKKSCNDLGFSSELRHGPGVVHLLNQLRGQVCAECFLDKPFVFLLREQLEPQYNDENARIGKNNRSGADKDAGSVKDPHDKEEDAAQREYEKHATGADTR